MTLEQAKSVSRKPSYLESDDGPIEAWKWAYEESFASRYFYPHNWVFRQRAYVMWDRDRLLHWNLFTTRRADLPPELDDAFRPTPAMEEEERISKRARSEAYINGGTGWWSVDDLSKVEWLEDP